MSAARQERLAALGITPEKPVINVIRGRPCPERSIISIREVPECLVRSEGRECFIGGKSAYCSHGLGPGTCAYCRDSSEGLRQFFAKLDFIPRSAEYDTSLLTAVIAFGAVVIYCVKRNNPASADADAEMVPADAIANPTLFKRLLNA